MTSAVQPIKPPTPATPVAPGECRPATPATPATFAECRPATLAECPTEASRFATFTECPMCGATMAPEHAHYRCTGCGWRDSCCD